MFPKMAFLFPTLVTKEDLDLTKLSDRKMLAQGGSSVQIESGLNERG
jgi:hypothetical protein